MSYADATTIVLGADGFLGRHLVAYWRARGWPVHPIGREAGDLTDPDIACQALREAPPAARILHTVTRQRTGAIQYDIQAELLAANARIHLNVLEAWRRHQPGAKLVTLGSSCVYPEQPTPLPETAFRTGAPHASVRGYALAKEMLAIGCELYAQQYGLAWLHCILATLYGPDAHTAAPRSHFMAAMIDRAVRARRAGDTTFEVWGSPATVRDLLYVEDQIEAIIAADAAFANQIVNVTANAPVTIGGCARAILLGLRWDADIVHPEGSFQGAGFKALDSTRFLAATGWAPKVALPDGVRLVLAANYADCVRV